MTSSFTYTFDADAEPLIRGILEDRGFRFKEAPYAHFTAQVPGCVVTFYQSGKLLIQGRQAPFWAETLSPRAVLGEGKGAFQAALDRLPSGAKERWIGSDESGKGDYFGPLVVCAVIAEREGVPLLEELGVTDSKRLSDRKALELAQYLEATLEHEVVLLRPERYNALYVEMGANLNRLLAWCHARAIENLLERSPDVSVAVVDRFGPESRLNRALMERGSRIDVVQRVRAEDDPAVASASVLARAVFIRQIRKLERAHRAELPKGAGPKVLAAARRFVKEHGREALEQVAKVHFKTTLAI